MRSKNSSRFLYIKSGKIPQINFNSLIHTQTSLTLANRKELCPYLQTANVNSTNLDQTSSTSEPGDNNITPFVFRVEIFLSVVYSYKSFK